MLKKIFYLNILIFSFLSSKEFVDGVGRKVIIKDKIERVITTAPANTEIIVDMELEDILIGVDSNSKGITKELDKKMFFVGNELNIDKILELNPDLVLLSEYNLPNGKEQLKIFDKNEISVYVIKNPKTVYEIANLIDEFGEILNRKDKSEELKNKYLNELEKIKFDDTKKRKKIYFEIQYNPIYSTGTGTFIDDIFKISGGENIFGEINGWFSPSLESVLERNPEYIFIGEDRKNELEKIKKRKEFRSIDAIKNDNVYFVDSSINRSSTRILKALRQIKYILEK